MSFTEQERKRLAELADVLIPVAEGRLSASEASVGQDGLDQLLATCPEAADALREMLRKIAKGDAEAAVTNLRADHAADFGALAEFTAGAYFLNPKVRALIGYAGQTARAIDERSDYLEDGLLESVIQRGPIYRPTPITT